VEDIEVEQRQQSPYQALDQSHIDMRIRRDCGSPREWMWTFIGLSIVMALGLGFAFYGYYKDGHA
jgi:hypothetical protein